MAKKVIRQILLIYLTTTGIFLTIFLHYGIKNYMKNWLS